MFNRKIQLRNCFVPTVLYLALRLNACSGVSSHLQITSVSISPEPIVGQIATLQIEIIATEDQADVTFTVDTLESAGNKVHLVSGDPKWQGSLVANQPQPFQFSICVVEEGTWPIEISAVAHLPNNGGIWDASEILRLKSTINSGLLIRDVDYRYSQTEAAQQPTPQPVTISSECSGQQK